MKSSTCITHSGIHNNHDFAAWKDVNQIGILLAKYYKPTRNNRLSSVTKMTESRWNWSGDHLIRPSKNVMVQVRIVTQKRRISNKLKIDRSKFSNHTFARQFACNCAFILEADSRGIPLYRLAQTLSNSIKSFAISRRKNCWIRLQICLFCLRVFSWVTRKQSELISIFP